MNNNRTMCSELHDTMQLPEKEPIKEATPKPMVRRGPSSSSMLYLVLLTTMVVSTQAALADRPDDTVLCPLHEYIDDNEETVREFFECPGLEDPPDHQLCCEERCCALIQLDSVLQVDIRIAMVLSLTVIAVCLVAGISLVLCCFLSSCPLYDTCAGGWSKTERERTRPPSFFNGYVAGEMHPMTLNGGRLLEKNNHHAKDVEPVKISEADHV